ncbi:MAG: DUF58 domain-containing protein [Rhodospirillales bacterium]|nr:DUF58 domain-containing protein [Rhodospirillales bacterium]
MDANRGDLHHKAEELAAALPPLLVAAERVAMTVSQGVHGRRRVGQGETFWQFRRYEPGDSTQRIDWRQSAKSDRVYIRETEWEAAQSVWLWRDASPSMHYQSAAALPSKLGRANLLLLALTVLLVRGGERVAMLGTGVPPSASRAALIRIARGLENGRAAETDDAPSLPGFEPLPRYGRLVLFGDFLSPLDEVRTAVAAFANRGVRGHLIQVFDPAEETLPFAGRVRFDGMEREGEILFGRVETVRERYRGELAAHRSALAEIVRAAGWTGSVHHTDRSPVAALLELYLALSEVWDR